MKLKRIILGALVATSLLGLSSCGGMNIFPSKDNTLAPDTNPGEDLESSNKPVIMRKVNLYSDNNLYKSLEIPDGMSIGEYSLYKKGFLLEDWCLNGIPYDTYNTPVTKDIRLDAKWKAADKDKTIVFYNNMGRKTLIEEAILEFQNKFEGWHVLHENHGSHDMIEEKVIKDFLTDTQPDITYAFNNHVAKYITTGKVVDLSKYINSKDTIKASIDNKAINVNIGYTKEELNDFNSEFMKDSYAKSYLGYEKYFNQDSIISMPFNKSTDVLYYNDDALKKLGLKVPKTLDELFSACEAVKKAYPNSTPLAIDSNRNFLESMWIQLGLNPADIALGKNSNDNKLVLDGLNKLKDYYNKGYFTTRALLGNYSSNLLKKGPEEGAVFSIGSSSGSAHCSSREFKVKVAPIPGILENNISKSFGVNLVMLDHNSGKNNDAKKLMTFLFMKELLDPNFQVVNSFFNGYAPVRKSCLKIDNFKEFLNDDDITSLTMKVVTREDAKFYVEPSYLWYDDFADELHPLLDYVITDVKTPEEALNDAIERSVF